MVPYYTAVSQPDGKTANRWSVFERAWAERCHSGEFAGRTGQDAVRLRTASQLQTKHQEPIRPKRPPRRRHAAGQKKKKQQLQPASAGNDENGSDDEIDAQDLELDV
jgi:hypothetical protein